MPKLDIDMFDETPHVGDKVKVVGKINSIDEDAGEVDVSYDKVSIMRKKKRSKNRDNDDDDDDTFFVETTDEQMAPNTQTLDDALARSFNRTQ